MNLSDSACSLPAVTRGVVWLTQVVVQLAVDKSRSVCLSVANGEVDVAIIGGHVPEDLKDVLQARLPSNCIIMQQMPKWRLCMLWFVTLWSV